MRLFVTCSSHLEPYLEQELQELGYSKTRQGFRGVFVDIPSISDIYRINYCLRTASRVLFPLLTFNCRGRDDLYEAGLKIHWFPYFRKAKTFAIDANVDHPKLRNSLFAAQVVKDAICDQLVKEIGKRPSVDTAQPDLQLNLFIREGQGILSLDTSGDALHKRGYRQEGGEAPLRETLAAALLKIGGYRAEDIMIDPCAGSATLLIEAAMMASKTPPGIYRTKWGFFHLLEFSEEEWLKVKIEEDSKRVPLQKGRFFGIELSKNAHRIALTNLRASGFHQAVSLTQGDFKEIEPSVPPTFLITNPPWGRRLDEEESLIPLYRSLGDFMKRKMNKPSKGFILTGSQLLSKEVGLAANKRHVVDNGGIESRLLEFEIY
jgi:putative N6-adenine-specific DNA methylase